MARKRYSAEEVVNKPRQAEVELSKGSTVARACKAIGATGPCVLQVASRARRLEDGPGEAFQAARAGEHAAEEARRGPVAG